MQRIGFVVFDGFQSMSFAALSVFEYANFLKEKPLYEMHFLSEKGGLVRSSTGMVVDSGKSAGRLAGLHAQGVEAFAPRRIDLHRRFHSRGSGHSGWQARDHPL